MKGRFDFLILHLLSKEEMYGFQIIKRFAENCAEDEFELKTGTLYPLLAAMEDRGFFVIENRFFVRQRTQVLQDNRTGKRISVAADGKMV